MELLFFWPINSMIHPQEHLAVRLRGQVEDVRDAAEDQQRLREDPVEAHLQAAEPLRAVQCALRPERLL